MLGTAYPIYSSLSLLESNASAKEKQQEAAQWLTYWAVYGVISAAEQLFESRPPLYYHIKLAFLFWLQHSNYQASWPCLGQGRSSGSGSLTLLSELEGLIIHDRQNLPVQ